MSIRQYAAEISSRRLPLLSFFSSALALPCSPFGTALPAKSSRLLSFLIHRATHSNSSSDVTTSHRAGLPVVNVLPGSLSFILHKPSKMILI